MSTTIDLSPGTDLVPAGGAPRAPAAAADQPWDVRITAERLALVGASVPWDLPAAEGRPLQAEALRAWCEARSERVSVHVAELGIGLHMARRELGQAAWQGWLRDAGISPARASEAMTLARLLFSAPPAAVPVLAAMPQRSLLALAPGGVQLIEALTQDGTLAEVRVMDRDAIRALVRERAETAALRERLERLARERDDARAQLELESRQTRAARVLAGRRAAALREIEHLRANALALARLVRELGATAELGIEVTTLGYADACHAVVYALQGLQALVDRTIADAWTLQAHYTPDARMPPPLFQPEEEERARAWAAQFLADADVRTSAQLDAAMEPVAPRRGRGRR